MIKNSTIPKNKINITPKTTYILPVLLIKSNEPAVSESKLPNRNKVDIIILFNGIAGTNVRLICILQKLYVFKLSSCQVLKSCKRMTRYFKSESQNPSNINPITAG